MKIELDFIVLIENYFIISINLFFFYFLINLFKYFLNIRSMYKKWVMKGYLFLLKSFIKIWLFTNLSFYSTKTGRFLFYKIKAKLFELYHFVNKLMEVELNELILILKNYQHWFCFYIEQVNIQRNYSFLSYSYLLYS